MNKVVNISTEEAKRIFEDSGVVMLDVRSMAEVIRGKIPGSIHVELDMLEREIEKVIADKNSRIIVYCLSGSRSVMGAEILEKMGYVNIYNLENGLLGWRNKGYPIS